MSHQECEDTDSTAQLHALRHTNETQRANVWQELIGLPMLTALIGDIPIESRTPRTACLQSRPCLTAWQHGHAGPRHHTRHLSYHYAVYHASVGERH